MDARKLVKIRTITVFVSLSDQNWSTGMSATISSAVADAHHVESKLVQAGYEVQTVRVATNPFGEWIGSLPVERLQELDRTLQQLGIDFCSVGPATNLEQIRLCPMIVATSGRLSTSVALRACDMDLARAAAECVQTIAGLDRGPHVEGGLGNFRFCTATAGSYIPSFPVAKAESDKPASLAIGLENGALAQDLLRQAGSIANMNVFRDGMVQALQPIQDICQSETKLHYLGIDSSLNPSLQASGSVAAAVEQLAPVTAFGAPGTIAASAAITTALQSLPDIQLTGYCGLMLPLCEDVRLAELANTGRVSIATLLSISHVCGVGVDTVPISGDCSTDELTGLLLDVAGIAERWNKSLSCRVFPVPGGSVGDSTTFDFPHLVNAKILPLS